MDSGNSIDELNKELQTLISLIDVKAYEDCLQRGLELADRFYGSPLLHYAIAVCLFETGRSGDATMHLEIAASKFELSSKSSSDELGQLIAIAGLLARTGHFAHIIPMIKNNLKSINWPKDNIFSLTEMVNICMTAESAETGLVLLESAFDTYINSELFTDYLLTTAIAAHATDNKDL